MCGNHCGVDLKMHYSMWNSLQSWRLDSVARSESAFPRRAYDLSQASPRRATGMQSVVYSRSTVARGVVRYRKPNISPSAIHFNKPYGPSWRLPMVQCFVIQLPSLMRDAEDRLPILYLAWAGKSIHDPWSGPCTLHGDPAAVPTRILSD